LANGEGRYFEKKLGVKKGISKYAGPDSRQVLCFSRNRPKMEKGAFDRKNKFFLTFGH
jgi:hypothetical protein